MRPLSQTLTDLIVVAEDLVMRSRFGTDPGKFSELAAEIRAADARPAEGERTTCAAMVTVTAIEAFRAASADAARPWLMLIGAALPLLRTDAWIAFNQEKAAREETRR